MTKMAVQTSVDRGEGQYQAAQGPRGGGRQRVVSARAASGKVAVHVSVDGNRGTLRAVLCTWDKPHHSPCHLPQEQLLWPVTCVPFLAAAVHTHLPSLPPTPTSPPLVPSITSCPDHPSATYLLQALVSRPHAAASGEWAR